MSLLLDAEQAPNWRSAQVKREINALRFNRDNLAQ